MPEQPHFGAHISEDTLEEYAFKRLSEAEAARVEEHLLVCEACQELLGDVDEYIHLMKGASPDGPRVKTRRRFGAYIAVAALALVSIAGVILVSLRRTGPPEPVDLIAVRGAEMARIHAGRPAVLRIQAADLADGPYRIEVVDSGGAVVWTGAAQASGQRIRVSEPKPLRAGIYWVRLYSSSNVLLREFGLESIR